MKVSTEIDNNFGYEKITQLVDNIPLRRDKYYFAGKKTLVRTKKLYEINVIKIARVCFY
jgi:hypothetical protein